MEQERQPNGPSSREEEHPCPCCERVFPTAERLAVHAKVHEGGPKRPYKCTECCRRFTRIDKLRAHEVVHRVGKPHKCELCDKAFTHKQTLIEHLLRHKGVRHHQCDLCPKGFYSHADLMSHRRRHTGERCYECNVCHRRFVGRADLLRHERLHDGDRPYRCTICNRCFSRNNILERHMMCHTGDRPYKCHLCPNTFTRSYLLREHCKDHPQPQRDVGLLCKRRKLHGRSEWDGAARAAAPGGSVPAQEVAADSFAVQEEKPNLVSVQTSAVVSTMSPQQKEALSLAPSPQHRASASRVKRSSRGKVKGEVKTVCSPSSAAQSPAEMETDRTFTVPEEKPKVSAAVSTASVQLKQPLHSVPLLKHNTSASKVKHALKGKTKSRVKTLYSPSSVAPLPVEMVVDGTFTVQKRKPNLAPADISAAVSTSSVQRNKVHIAPLPQPNAITPKVKRAAAKDKARARVKIACSPSSASSSLAEVAADPFAVPNVKPDRASAAISPGSSTWLQQPKGGLQSAPLLQSSASTSRGTKAQKDKGRGRGTTTHSPMSSSSGDCTLLETRQSNPLGPSFSSSEDGSSLVQDHAEGGNEQSSFCNINSLKNPKKTQTKLPHQQNIMVASTYCEREPNLPPLLRPRLTGDTATVKQAPGAEHMDHQVAFMVSQPPPEIQAVPVLLKARPLHNNGSIFEILPAGTGSSEPGPHTPVLTKPTLKNPSLPLGDQMCEQAPQPLLDDASFMRSHQDLPRCRPTSEAESEAVLGLSCPFWENWNVQDSSSADSAKFKDELNLMRAFSACPVTPDGMGKHSSTLSATLNFVSAWTKYLHTA